MKKIVIIIVILIVGGFVYYKNSSIQPDAEDFIWQFTQSRVDEDGIPYNEVNLTYNGVTRTLGTFQGDCFLVEQADLWKDELSGVYCYWEREDTSGGVQLGVFKIDGRFQVEKAIFDEELDPPQQNFKTLFSL